MDKAIFNHIQEIVCKEFCISPKNIRGDSRYSDYVLARKFIAFFCLQKEITTVFVGKHMRKDHASVIYYRNFVEKALSERNTRIVQMYDDLKLKLETHVG